MRACQALPAQRSLDPTLVCMAEDNHSPSPTPLPVDLGASALIRPSTPTRRVGAAVRNASPGRRAGGDAAEVVPAPVVTASRPARPTEGSAGPASAALDVDEKRAAGIIPATPPQSGRMQNFDGVQSRVRRCWLRSMCGWIPQPHNTPRLLHARVPEPSPNPGAAALKSSPSRRSLLRSSCSRLARCVVVLIAAQLVLGMCVLEHARRLTS